jgi:hypothetical protein
MTRVQCAKCPWKRGTNPHEIPRGYSVKKHRALARTIAEPGAYSPAAKLNLMACHESALGNEIPCVGWLANQLGPGNNIGLRIAATRDRSLGDFELVGEQHERFEDTLP